jgi:hypothetical protein
MRKKYFSFLFFFISVQSHAQIPIAQIIQQAIKKVIVAVDLKIQRIQTKTIWLQNAQKTIENTMSKLRLTEISGWVEKQRKLYDEYFQELWKVKEALLYYQRTKDIIETGVALVNEYRGAWQLFQQDHNFSTGELEYMFKIYSGILQESMKNVDQLGLVINSFSTQMSDGKRLQLINQTAETMDQFYTDLKQFNNQNKVISLQRATEKGEIEYVKRLYGL